MVETPRQTAFESDEYIEQQKLVDGFVHKLSDLSRNSWLYDSEKRKALQSVEGIRDIANATGIHKNSVSAFFKKDMDIPIQDVTPNIFAAFKEAVTVLEARGGFGMTVSDFVHRWKEGDLFLQENGIYALVRGEAGINWVGILVAQGESFLAHVRKLDVYRHTGLRITPKHAAPMTPDEFRAYCEKHSITSVIYKSPNYLQPPHSQLPEQEDVQEEVLPAPVSREAVLGALAFLIRNDDVDLSPGAGGRRLHQDRYAHIIANALQIPEAQAENLLTEEGVYDTSVSTSLSAIATRYHPIIRNQLHDQQLEALRAALKE